MRRKMEEWGPRKNKNTDIMHVKLYPKTYLKYKCIPALHLQIIYQEYYL